MSSENKQRKLLYMERGVLVLKHNTKFRHCIASEARRAEDAIPVFCTKLVD